MYSLNVFSQREHIWVKHQLDQEAEHFECPRHSPLPITSLQMTPWGFLSPQTASSQAKRTQFSLFSFVVFLACASRGSRRGRGWRPSPVPFRGGSQSVTTDWQEQELPGTRQGCGLSGHTWTHWIGSSGSEAQQGPPQSVSRQSYPTLFDPVDCSPLGCSVHGILQQEHRSGLPFPSLKDLPDPGIQPRSPALQADSLSNEPPPPDKSDAI